MTLRFNIFGLFGVPCGLRVAALNTARMLEALGYEVDRVEVSAKGRIAGVQLGRSAGVNIYHVNPDLVLRLLLRNRPADLGVSEALNVCVPFWELPVIPNSWRSVLAAMDLVLAPSRFIHDALTESAVGTDIRPYPQAVVLPANVTADRDRYGLDDDTIAFVVSFAVESSLDRKYPEAAIAAFEKAFPGNEDVRLLVRVQSLGQGRRASAALDRLRSVSVDPRIRFLTAPMTYEEVLSLYASADVYVSLHRSEGLGLGPMEAMALGKPVVATGWSGNVDFMTGSNSLPIGYRLVPVDVRGSSPYGRRRVPGVAMWAEPDVDQAAAAMRTLALEPATRGRIGVQAGLDAETRLREYMNGTIVSVLEDAARRMRTSSARQDTRLVPWVQLRRRALRDQAVRRPVVKLARTVVDLMAR